MENTIAQRLESFMYRIGESQVSFSKKTGIPQSTIATILSRNTGINSSAIEKLNIAFPLMSLEWFILGKGEMLKTETSAPQVSYSRGCPYYNVDFIGGFDVVLNDQTINPDYNIDFPPYNKDGVMWCNITGHSMEPEISSGDMMAIKEVKEWDKFLTMNETYAIVTKNDLRTVKKVRKGRDSNHLLLVPVNKAYDEQEIPKEMIHHIFSVLGCMKRF